MCGLGRQVPCWSRGRTSVGGSPTLAAEGGFLQGHNFGEPGLGAGTP